VREQKLLGLESWRGDFHRDPGLFTVEAKLSANATFEEIETAVQNELGRIARGEYPPTRITELLSNLRYQLPLELQTPSQAAQSVARFMALTGEVETLSNYHRRLGEVTSTDVARVAAQYLIPARRSTVSLRDAASAPADAVRVGPGSSAVRRGGVPRAPAAPAAGGRPR